MGKKRGTPSMINPAPNTGRCLHSRPYAMATESGSTRQPTLNPHIDPACVVACCAPATLWMCPIIHGDPKCLAARRAAPSDDPYPSPWMSHTRPARQRSRHIHPLGVPYMSRTLGATIEGRVDRMMAAITLRSWLPMQALTRGNSLVRDAMALVVVVYSSACPRASGCLPYRDQACWSPRSPMQYMSACLCLLRMSARKSMASGWWYGACRSGMMIASRIFDGEELVCGSASRTIGQPHGCAPIADTESQGWPSVSVLVTNGTDNKH